jgi:hypothetical protein
MAEWYINSCLPDECTCNYWSDRFRARGAQEIKSCLTDQECGNDSWYNSLLMPGKNYSSGKILNFKEIERKNEGYPA